MNGGKQANKEVVRKRTFQKNLETFKLLTTNNEGFDNKINEIRQRLKASSNNLSKNIKETLLAVEYLLEEFNLPYIFKKAVSNYLLYGKIDERKDIPDINYFFEFSPKPLAFTSSRKPKERVWAVNLVTYTKLTNEELSLAIKGLKRIQKWAFPATKIFSGTIKPRKNIDLELDIEKAGKHRKRNQTEEEFDDQYLVEIKKKYDAGKISPKEYERIRKLNAFNIKKVKRGGYTSFDIAMEKKPKVLSSAIRQGIKRTKKERLERFGRKT